MWWFLGICLALGLLSGLGNSRPRYYYEDREREYDHDCGGGYDGCDGGSES